VQLDLRAAHEYWGGCVHELWETLTPKLDELSESRCEHDCGKVCISCKLKRRAVINSFLWADFVMDPNTKNTEYLEVIEGVLHNALMVIAAQGVHLKEGWTSLPENVSYGEERLLGLLQKL
jgi:hypothetical protein